MGTAYSDVFDAFMGRIKDWKLDALYVSSTVNFETYLTVFLKDAVFMFKNCNQSLARSDTTKLFTETLTETNVLILAKLMVKAWLEKEVHDIRQMNMKITDKDFKTYSEAQHLREKSNELSRVMEENSQTLLEYGYDSDTLWDNWIAGTFYTSSS